MRQHGILGALAVWLAVAAAALAFDTVRPIKDKGKPISAASPT